MSLAFMPPKEVRHDGHYRSVANNRLVAEFEIPSYEILTKTVIEKKMVVICYVNSRLSTIKISKQYVKSVLFLISRNPEQKRTNAGHHVRAGQSKPSSYILRHRNYE